MEHGDYRIRLGKLSDMAGVEALYSAVHDAVEAGPNYSGWKRGWYPTPEIARDGIEAGEFYVLEIGGEIAGTAVLNHEQSEAYSTLTWGIPAQGEEILLVHTLAVHPAFRGQGIAGELLAFAERLACQKKCKCIRFDTSSKNLPAIHCYESRGYRFVGLVDLGLNIPGHELFRCYEKAVQR